MEREREPQRIRKRQTDHKETTSRIRERKRERTQEWNMVSSFSEK